VNPNLAAAHVSYANELIELNRPEELKREVDRALELDPPNDFYRSFYGWQFEFRRPFAMVAVAVTNCPRSTAAVAPYLIPSCYPTAADDRRRLQNRRVCATCWR
jgi:hypothetical protein